MQDSYSPLTMPGVPSPTPPLRSVLVVDDHEHGYVMVARALRGLHSEPGSASAGKHDSRVHNPATSYESTAAQVRWATSAAEALSVRRDHAVDAMFIDVHLGRDRSGLDLLRDLRQSGITHPLIVLTATDDLAIEQACLDAGADDVLIKSEVRAASIRRALRFAFHRQQLTRRLREQNRKYVDLARNYPQGSVLVFRGGRCSLAAGSCSSVLLRTGPDQCAGRSPHQLLPAAIADFVLDALVESDGARESDPLLQCSIEDRHYLVRVSSDRDDPDEHLVIIQDVTDFKLTEEAMLRSVRLASIGTLASGLAHELNNLHNVITGNVERALREVEEVHPIHRRLTTVQDCCRRAGEVTTNLMTFARGFKSGFTLCDLNEIVTETAQLIYQELVSCNTAFELDLQPLPRLWLQSSAFGQVVINLLLNAHQALHATEQRMIEITTRQLGGRVQMSVTDNGCGMPEDVRERIFEPFFTTKDGSENDRHTRKAIYGTGIGMSVCHTIVENHGGRIEVDSRVGSGTTVTIDLPLHTLAPMDTASARLDDGGETVLVASADEGGLVGMLGEQGWQVEACRDAAQAICRLDAGDVAVLIVDLTLPHHDGWRILEHLTHHPSPPAVVTICDEQEEDLQDSGQLLHLGLVDEQLSTPIDPEALRGAVAAVTARRSGGGSPLT